MDPRMFAAMGTGGVGLMILALLVNDPVSPSDKVGLVPPPLVATPIEQPVIVAPKAVHHQPKPAARKPKPATRKPKPGPKKPNPAAGKPKAAAKATTAARSGDGPSIKGRILWSGKAPKNGKISPNSDPFCAANCEENFRKETTVIGPDGGLKNVVVYISKGLPKQNWTQRTTPVVLDQINCTYVPHVFAIQVGQPLKIKSSDNTSHNVHLVSKSNGGWNISQNKPSTIDPVAPLGKPEIGGKFKCDQHTWMECRFCVFDHPFFAVTGDDGSFEIDGSLPPGDYTLTAWHEKWKTKEQKVTVTADGTVSLSMSFEKTKTTRRR